MHLKSYFHEYDSFPGGLENFLKTPATEAHRLFKGKSALIRLFEEPIGECSVGRSKEPLFVSVLQHGNEVTGWIALQRLLKDAGLKPRRPLWIWVGNVMAAAEGLRQLPGQPDYNRLWAAPDTAPNHFGNLYPFTIEEKMACQLLERLKGIRFFAAIDVHNTSGKNPHYACLNQLSSPFLFLSHLFSKDVIYFTKPHEVLGSQLAKIMPAVTLECGQPGTEAGVAKVIEVLRDLLMRDAFPEREFTEEDLNIYRSIARIVIDEAAFVSYDDSYAMGSAPADSASNDCDGGTTLIFDPAIDRWNLLEVPKGTCFGRMSGMSGISAIRVLDEKDQDVTSRYLLLKEGKIFAVGNWVASMFTTTPSIAKSDCLGYVMERYIESL